MLWRGHGQTIKKTMQKYALKLIVVVVVSEDVAKQKRIACRKIIVGVGVRTPPDKKSLAAERCFETDCCYRGDW